MPLSPGEQEIARRVAFTPDERFADLAYDASAGNREELLREMSRGDLAPGALKLLQEQHQNLPPEVASTGAPGKFDLDGARKAGYGDAEIASFLAPQAGFDLAGAKKAGYSDTEIVDHLAPPPPLRSAPGEILTGLKRGAFGQFPQQIGQAMKWFGDEPKSIEEGGLGSTAYEIGQSLENVGTDYLDKNENQLNPAAHNWLTNALSSGAEMVVPSVAPAAIAALLPETIPAWVALGIGATSMSAMYGGSQAQQTYEKAIKSGLTPDAARRVGIETGAYEAGGEILGTMALGYLFGTVGRGISKAAGVDPVQGVFAAVQNPAYFKDFVKKLPAVYGTEIGTEMGQNAAEAWAEQRSGIPTDISGGTPWEQAQQAVAPTFGMTTLLAPFGLYAHRKQAQQGTVAAGALQDSTAPQEIRTAAAGSVYAGLKAVDKPFADQWYARAKEAIANGAPVGLDRQFAEPTPTPESKPLIGSDFDAPLAAVQALDNAPDATSAVAAAAAIVEAPTAAERDWDAAEAQRQERVAQIERMAALERQRDAERTEAGRQAELAAREQSQQASQSEDFRGLIARNVEGAPQTAMSLALARAAGSNPPGYVSQDELARRMEEWNRRQNAGTVRGNQAVLPEGRQGPEGGRALGGNDLQRAPGAGINPNGSELRETGGIGQPEQALTDEDRLTAKRTLYQAYSETGAPADVVGRHVLKAQERANERGEAMSLWKAPGGQLGLVPANRRSPLKNGVLVATIHPENAFTDEEIARRMTASIPENFTPAAPLPITTPTVTIMGATPDKLTTPELRISAEAAAKPEQRQAAKVELDRRAQAYKQRGMLLPENDSMFTAIAKLGGLNKQDVVSSWGVDPADVKGLNPIFGKPLLRTNGGLSIDGMAELLVQHGYLDQRDLQEFERKFDQELRGKPVLTPQGMERQAAATAEATASDQAAEVRTATLELTPEDLKASGYDKLSVPEQEQAQAIIDGLVEYARGKPYEALIDAIIERAIQQTEGRPYKEYAHAVIAQIKEVIKNAESTDNQSAQVVSGASSQGNEGAGAAAHPEGRVAAEPIRQVAGAELALTGQTAAEVKAAGAAAQREAAAKKQREAAPPPEEFTLAGSNRQADQATAHGQQELAPAQTRHKYVDASGNEIQLARTPSYGFGVDDATMSAAEDTNGTLWYERGSYPKKAETLLSKVPENKFSDTWKARAQRAPERQNVGTSSDMATARHNPSESPTERPYRDTQTKALQHLARETEDDAVLKAVEDELNTRAEEKAQQREERLAKGRAEKAKPKEPLVLPDSLRVKPAHMKEETEAAAAAEAALKEKGIKFSRSEEQTNGKNQRTIPTQPDETYRAQTQALEAALKDGGYDFKVTPVSLSERVAGRSSEGQHDEGSGRRDSFALASRISGVFGKEVIPVTLDGDWNADGVVLPGSPLSKYVFLDVRSDRPAHVVLGHELSHHMEQDAPAVYKDLVQALRPMLDAEGYREARSTIGPSEDYIVKEMIGDLLGNNFGDQKFWAEVAKRSTAFGKIVATIRQWLADLTAKLKDMAGFQVEQFVSDVEDARKVLAAATVDYLDYLRNRGNGVGGYEAKFARPIADSETTGDYKDTFAAKATDFMTNYFTSFDKIGWWQKTVGTPFNLALTNKEFAPFYDEGQAYINDISRYGNESADLAQDLLPRVEHFRDVLPAWLGGKTAAQRGDVMAASKALYAGTLWGNGSPMEGRVWTDSELKSGRAMDNGVSIPAFNPMNAKQIALYRQALAATSKSMDELAKSLIQRIARQADVGFDRGMSLEDVAVIVGQQLEDKLGAATNAGNEALVKELQIAKASVADIADKAKTLNEAGYFPAMRFGKYALHVVNGGKQLYFGMYESKAQALVAEQKLKQEFPGAEIQKGVIPKEKYKLFQGLSLDALEAFSDYIVDAEGNKVAKDALVQGLLKAATAERSVMKRHIHRKGIPGYSEDVPRVLASFVVSSARAIASNYHAAEMLKLAQDIKAGDVSDYAAKLARYMLDPVEEAQGLRGFLFAQYLGGSIASGLVNMTQPFMVTAPWASKYTSYADAVAKLGKAGAENADALTGKIGEAYRRAKREGIVTPQEIHQLRAETGGGLGARSLAMRKLSFAWGSIFSLAEQFNRKSTFLAAYRIAEEMSKEDKAKHGITNSYDFAKQAVAETQFTYNKGNRPVFSRGMLGATVMTFKQFSISYLEMAHRLYKTDKKAFALLALTLLAAGGIEGLPFAEDLEDLVDTMGQWLGYATNSKKKVRQWAMTILGPDLSQVALRGVSGLSWMPVDISARMGMANLIPGTAALKPSEKNKTKDVVEMLGPAGQFLPLEGTMMGNALERLGKGDLGGAIKAAAPQAIQAAVKGGEMLETGKATDLKGRKITAVSPGEAVLKMAGLQPASVARESQKIGIVQQDIDLVNRMKAEIAEQWARGIVDKDPAEVRAARDKMARWNEDNNELRIHVNSQAVQQRIKEMRMTREERFTKRAPREIRAGVREALR